MTTHVLADDQLEFCCNGVREGDAWFAYENQVLDSSALGTVQYLLVGPTRTHKTPPPQLGDGKHGLGWKWRLLGKVDLTTGKVKP